MSINEENHTCSRSIVIVVVMVVDVTVSVGIVVVVVVAVCSVVSRRACGGGRSSVRRMSERNSQ